MKTRRMKHWTATVLASLFFASMILLTGCSSKVKIFSIEDPQKIVITSLSGKKTEITEETLIQQITNSVAAVRFERGKSSKNANGFGPFLSWYDSDGDLIESISVMGNDTILYEDHFWEAADGSDLEELYTILVEHNAFV